MVLCSIWIPAIAVDAAEIQTWTLFLDTRASDFAFGIRKAPDDGFIVTGQSNLLGKDPLVSLIGPDGQPVWQKVLINGLFRSGGSFRQSAAGGFVGLTTGSILKLKADGSPEWRKEFFATSIQ